MKKLLLVLAILSLVLCVPALAEDAISSASVADFYGDYAITGDELMDAINSFSGFYLVTTVNPDGTPLSGFFIYACKKIDDTYYLQFGLAENQSRQNLVANDDAYAVYAAAPSTEEGAKPYAVAGARMKLKKVTDEDVLSTLSEGAYEGTLFFEIVECRSLG